MMKKLAILLFVLCFAFAFTACGDSSSEEATADEATTEAVAAESEAADVDEAATEGFTKASQGETITLDWGEFTIGNFGHGDYLENKDGVKYNPSNDNAYIWLPIEFKNLSKDPIELTGWWMMGKFVINGEYNYEGDATQIDGAWTIQPLETRTLYVRAEVPKDVANSYETIAAQFAFNDNFHDYDTFDDEITDLDHVYEVKGSK